MQRLKHCSRCQQITRNKSIICGCCLCTDCLEKDEKWDPQPELRRYLPCPTKKHSCYCSSPMNHIVIANDKCFASCSSCFYIDITRLNQFKCDVCRRSIETRDGYEFPFVLFDSCGHRICHECWEEQDKSIKCRLCS